MGGSSGSTSRSVVAEIINAREQIKNSLTTVDSVVSVTSGSSAPSSEMTSRLQQLEKENADLKKVTDELRALVLSLDSRVKALEGPKSASAPSAPVQPPKPAEQKKEEEDDDDDVDLFGDDDEEDEDAERIKQERIAAYSLENQRNLS